MKKIIITSLCVCHLALLGMDKTPLNYESLNQEDFNKQLYIQEPHSKMADKIAHYDKIKDADPQFNEKGYLKSINFNKYIKNIVNAIETAVSHYLDSNQYLKGLNVLPKDVLNTEVLKELEENLNSDFLFSTSDFLFSLRIKYQFTDVARSKIQEDLFSIINNMSNIQKCSTEIEKIIADILSQHRIMFPISSLLFYQDQNNQYDAIGREIEISVPYKDINKIKVIDFDSYLNYVKELNQLNESTDNYQTLSQNSDALYHRFFEIIDEANFGWEVDTIHSDKSKVKICLNTTENFVKKYKTALKVPTQNLIDTEKGRESLAIFIMAYDLTKEKDPNTKLMLAVSPKNGISTSFPMFDIYFDSESYDNCLLFSITNNAMSTLSQSADGSLYHEINHAVHKILGTHEDSYDFEKYIKNDFFRELLYPNFDKIRKEVENYIRQQTLQLHLNWFQKIFTSKEDLKKIEEYNRSQMTFLSDVLEGLQDEVIKQCKNKSIVERASKELSIENIAWCFTAHIMEFFTGNAEEIYNILGVYFKLDPKGNMNVYVNKMSEFNYLISRTKGRAFRILHAFYDPIKEEEAVELSIIEKELAWKINEQRMCPTKKALETLYKLHGYKCRF